MEQQLQQQRHKSQPLLPLQDESDGSWQERLRRVLVEARAGHYFERACSVCDDLGVAFFGEVAQNADDIADRLKMKKLEYDRFLRAIAAARGARQTFFLWGGAACSSRYERTPSVHVSLEVDASYEICLRNTRDRCLSRSSPDNINLSH